MPKRAKMHHPRAVPTQRPQDDDAGRPEMAFAEGVHDELDPNFRYRLISDAAYALYCKRGYVDGYDMDDWFEAEAQVDHMVLNPAAADSGSPAQG